MQEQGEPAASARMQDMSAGQAYVLRLKDVLANESFRLSACFSATAALLTLVLFGFIFWQTASSETRRIDAFLTLEARQVADQPEAELRRAVETRLANDFHRVNFVGLFGADGVALAGNLRRLPDGVRADGRVHAAAIDLDPASTTRRNAFRVVERRLPDGRILAIGRDILELQQLRRVVLRALLLGLLPASALSLVAGAMLSLRALSKVRAMDRTLGRIMRGDLQQRLRVGSGRDSLDQLARSVNGALDEIGRLVGEISSVGASIAHDLRTPLSRLRARLELHRAYPDGSDANLVIEHSLSDLNRTLTIITALLRIGEIESGRRRAGFQPVDVGEACAEIFDLYEPLAEAKLVGLAWRAGTPATLLADRELLLEALANLTENAIKFSPPGGMVTLSLVHGAQGCTIRVSDTGPGVPEGERAAILGRFYRSDPRRARPGHGLGLSIVDAIARLHGFTLAVGGDSSGAIFELFCPWQPRAAWPVAPDRAPAPDWIVEPTADPSQDRRP